jgi:hypothetical protein
MHDAVHRRSCGSRSRMMYSATRMMATMMMTVSMPGLQAATQNRMTELLGSGEGGQGSGHADTD